MGSHVSGSHVSSSQWWVRLPGALNWGSALLPPGAPARSTTHGPVAELTLPDPPLVPCLRVLFSFAWTSLSCRHGQGSDCLECCCLTHRGKTSCLARVWVPDQRNRKEKWCLCGVGWAREAWEPDDWEACLLSIWAILSFPGPIYTIPQTPRASLYPPSHTPQLSSEGRERTVDLGHFWSQDLAVGEVSRSPAFMLVLGGVHRLSLASWIPYLALETHLGWNPWCARPLGIPVEVW